MSFQSLGTGIVIWKSHIPAHLYLMVPDSIILQSTVNLKKKKPLQAGSCFRSTIPAFVCKFSLPFCLAWQYKNEIQITLRGAFSLDNHALMLHTRKWLECDRDGDGRTQSPHSRHDLQTFWETGNRSVNSLTDDFFVMFGYFWLFFSFFFRCTAILSLSLSCDNAFISPHPTPKRSPPFPFPIPTHKRKAEILQHPDTLQY